MQNKLLLSLFLLGTVMLSACTKKHENPLSDLADKRIHSLNMYFYPSTIRMINVAEDESFYEATKDIKNLQFMSVNTLDTANYKSFEKWEEAQDFTNWEELLSASLMGSLATIYAPEGTDDIYFVKMKSEGTIYLAWAEGKVNLKELMNIAQNGIDLGPLNDYIGNIDKAEKRKAVREKARADMKKLEEADSLEQNN